MFLCHASLDGGRLLFFEDVICGNRLLVLGCVFLELGFGLCPEFVVVGQEVGDDVFSLLEEVVVCAFGIELIFTAVETAGLY